MALFNTNTRKINAAEPRQDLLRDANVVGAGNTFFTDKFKTLKNSLRKTGLAIVLSATAVSAAAGLFPTLAAASGGCYPAGAEAYTEHVYGLLTGTNTIITSNVTSNMAQSVPTGSPNIDISLYQTKGSPSIQLQSDTTIDFPDMRLMVPASTYLIQFSTVGSSKISYQTTINDPPPVNGISATFTYAQLGMTPGQMENITITASNLLVHACTVGPISPAPGQIVTYTFTNPPTTVTSSKTFQYLGPPILTNGNVNGGNG